MCTSFVFRNEENVVVGMNFDSDCEGFRLIKKPDLFAVEIKNKDKLFYPSFGVNANGTFINNLMVEPCERGLYKRASKLVTNTSKLTEDILKGRIAIDELDNYLKDVEVVNCPNMSVHNMIVNKTGDVWIVEPGRGIIKSEASETNALVMTNFSLYAFKNSMTIEGTGAERYVNTMYNLSEAGEFLSLSAAFDILKKVSQNGKNIKTLLSLVYIAKEKTAYYCLNSDYRTVEKHFLD